MTSLGHDLSSIGVNNLLVMGRKINNKPRNNNFGRGFDMTSSTNIKHNKMNEPPHNLALQPDMDADFSSVDNRIVSEEPKLSKEDPQETRHLKELLLLHLDWIQQQQEALLTKDRQIQRLKQEKEALKCRLERMDRRMALLRHKSERSPQRQSNEHILQDKAKTAPPAHSSGRGEILGRGSKRKHSLEPRSLNRKFDFVADEQTSNIETSNKSTSTDYDVSLNTPKKSKQRTARNTTKWDSPLKQSYLYSQQPPRKCRSQSLVISEESLAEDEEIETENEMRSHLNDSDTDDEVQIMDHSSRKRDDMSQLSKSGDHDCIQATGLLYYVPIETNLPSWEISPVKDNVEDVRVPTFRVKHVPTGYQLEGTENLTDEAFLKRHQKPEADEKRRKRWDAQMLREQKMLEHLQKREVACKASTSKNGTAGTSKKTELEEIQSFLPDPENARYLEICDDVPVSAFGYTVPKLDDAEFSLPWFDFEKRSRDEKGRLSLRK